MKSVINITFILTLIFSCSKENKTKINLTKKVEYGYLISEYLESKKLEPNMIFNNSYYTNKNIILDLLIMKLNSRRKVTHSKL